MRTVRRYDFGDQATGVVVDEHDWGPRGPRMVRPRRYVSGVVVGLFADAPAVVKVQTRDGETVCIKTGTPLPNRYPSPYLSL